jgi:LDH2 family malate/lactate/ureidoglycolate dehydrogenase
MDAERVRHLEPATLAGFATEVLVASGLGRDHAELIADTLVAADLRGTTSHGIIRLPFLAARLRRGGANPRPALRTLREDVSTALVDGDRGLGQVTGVHCMRLAIGKARRTGVGVVVATNSDWLGACAYYAMQALAVDMIGLAWTNGYPGMAPFGGRENRICNNPLAVAVPTASGEPIVLDMAMSVVAGGRVRVAAKHRERIPEGWIVDRHGRPTDDPEVIWQGGTLLPLGYKGYGLAVIGEILAGVLGGARILDEIPSWLGEPERAVGSGHFHLAIDIARFCDVDAFKARIGTLAAILKATPRQEGIEEILLPGEPENRIAARQAEEGIAVLEQVVEDLAALARELDLTLPAWLG